MKVTGLNNIHNIRQSAVKTTAAIAATLGFNTAKKTPKTTYDRDFGIWGRTAELQAVQNIARIQGLKINPNGRVIIIAGSSGVGKDTLLKAFLEDHPDFQLSVSHTTRKQRPGEVDGKDYYFITDEEFQHGIENGEFIEWADFAGNKYGTKRTTIVNMLNKTNNLFLKLDTKGALKMKKLIPQATLIFIAPPSIKELEERLRGRGTETESAIQRRLSAIKTEMKNVKYFDYQIVNDTIENAKKALEKIIIP